MQRVRQTGVDIDLRIEGDRRPLRPAVDLSAYRIVQEGLTNVLKHSDAARAEVTVRYDARHAGPRGPRRRTGAVDVAPHADTASTACASGVELLHGTITAGARPTGGYELAVAACRSMPDDAGDAGRSA